MRDAGEFWSGEEHLMQSDWPTCRRAQNLGSHELGYFSVMCAQVLMFALDVLLRCIVTSTTRRWPCKFKLTSHSRRGKWYLVEISDDKSEWFRDTPVQSPWLATRDLRTPNDELKIYASDAGFESISHMQKIWILFNIISTFHLHYFSLILEKKSKPKSSPKTNIHNLLKYS
jgi:hypothetical protein